MATLFITSQTTSPRTCTDLRNKAKNKNVTFSKSRKAPSFSLKDEQESEPTSTSSSPVAVVKEKPNNGGEAASSTGNEVSVHELDHGIELEAEELEKQEEMDWKMDEEFKTFMGNPLIEAVIKLEKERADRTLKELDRESSSDHCFKIRTETVCHGPPRL
ncbi:hypothetical protein LWI28_003219 [Acer negundo]|uniref:Uncharacterized protein n=1 Tax=Acer negundo TaxID=4023 RepID=A0AAD5IY80_ACENE|nr:hypothetical protein LWI28_003219 [Acer negundo]KAK4848459.1 hypothetical protein QYF36_013289 [Acer negundo]